MTIFFYLFIHLFLQEIIGKREKEGDSLPCLV